ncbi:hypothetical protein CkaCkLH20_09690 [Colletotrichum karsti]|uniref:Uncharacterized protein n=1 Tax=Colletotrichum karsti TaxID=1095194 RepID=A0A9P6HZ58_9PEZI|nr:uncharacterized protein CkaCkLH20_09690 [Colletotrichum karsti]KAF9872827.1 hypothetical protein CkaCkLH20_09690 [Colletotrichum karsti]
MIPTLSPFRSPLEYSTAMSAPNITVQEQYKPGTTCKIWPYTPTKPHGTSAYPRNPLPPDLPAGQVRGWTESQEAERHHAMLRITSTVAVGDNRTSQVFCCTIISSPAEDHQLSRNGEPITTTLAAEVFDPNFYPSGLGAPYNNRERADGTTARVAAVFEHLVNAGWAGPPHAMPRYYGCWVMRPQTLSPEGHEAVRYVTLVLREYILGRSIESLCDRDEYNCLVPKEKHRQHFHLSKEPGKGIVRLKLKKNTRFNVFKQALHGHVQHLHLGFKHGVFEPGNVFLTMYDGETDKDLEEPRAVLIGGYDLVQIWSLTKAAKGPLGDRQIIQYLKYPPHPAERFGPKGVDAFVGWCPSDPVKFRNWETEYREWMVRPSVFGPLEEAEYVERELGGEDVEWPHPYPKFSIFKTLYDRRRDIGADQKRRHESYKEEESRQQQRLALEQEAEQVRQRIAQRAHRQRHHAVTRNRRQQQDRELQETEDLYRRLAEIEARHGSMSPQP